MKSIIDDEPGADGVPTEAINAKTAIKIMFWIVRVYPELAAIKIAAITCIIAVPFILIVIPNGSTKEAISLLTPSSSTVVFSFSDKAAEEAAAENPKRATLATFFINIIGFSFVPK